MTQQPVLDHLLTSFLSTQDLISFSGESGTGKTTLALQIAGFLLTHNPPYKHQCIWIQASEPFPKQRLLTLFDDDIQKLKYLQKNIFVFPGNGCFPTFKSQLKAFSSFSEQVLSPDLKVIIIDNISHHLRYWLMQQEDLTIRGKILDEFYTNQLFPLLMRCQREEIYLVLIHEVSYNVKKHTTKLFFSQLYERLEMLYIILTKSIKTQLRTLKITDYDSELYVRVYELSRQGFILL
jgi:hypothetical protein